MLSRYTKSLKTYSLSPKEVDTSISASGGGKISDDKQEDVCTVLDVPIDLALPPSYVFPAFEVGIGWK